MGGRGDDDLGCPHLVHNMKPQVEMGPCCKTSGPQNQPAEEARPRYWKNWGRRGEAWPVVTRRQGSGLVLPTSTTHRCAHVRACVCTHTHTQVCACIHEHTCLSMCQHPESIILSLFFAFEIEPLSEPGVYKFPRLSRFSSSTFTAPGL